MSSRFRVLDRKRKRNPGVGGGAVEEFEAHVRAPDVFERKEGFLEFLHFFPIHEKRDSFDPSEDQKFLNNGVFLEESTDQSRKTREKVLFAF